MNASVTVFSEGNNPIEAHRIKDFRELVELMLELDRSVQSGDRVEIKVK
jgi:hypothetical protein